MKFINVVVASLFVLIYLSVNVPPTQKYNLWLLTFAIPIVIVINFCLFLLYALLRRVSSIVYLIALLFSWPFMVSTYGMKRYFSSDPCASDSSFTLLSYNVSGLKIPKRFNSFVYSSKNDRDSSTFKIREWILNDSADVKCFQEFFDNGDNPYLKVIKALNKKGYSCVFSSDAQTNQAPEVGIMIASKFPILRHGDILVSENGYNRTLFADLKIGNDTVRIINMHLESMEMKKYNPVYVDDVDDKKQRMKVVLRKLRSGVFERSKQLKQILATVESSPYPVICVGDLNELPYSYAYRLLSKNLKNSFEEKGKGFGFTYNGKTLQVLRIDNQFFSNGIGIQQFNTLRDVPYTDHFPLLGTYRICTDAD